ncbi:pectinesterase family protein [Streptomyces sp. STCH 565 A]|uniref:pectinesterase family protein n=1 Tax=Streptomyces sp. STCH 565 A TaxID=2950532 RepID=UPI002074C51D|nr:pectinesterase family protein [Streptomyces sp. STCH 565 A]MCM8550753.1 pectinesterase family protein [Streptomyces sp. STCH 565 A]
MRSMFRQLVSRLRPVLRAGPVVAVLLAPAVVAPGVVAPPSAAAAASDASGGRGPVLEPGGTETAVCADTPLRLTFGSAVRLGTEGRLRVHRADGRVVDTVDLADPASYQRFVGDARSDYGQPHRWTYEPVVVAGRTATVLPHRALAPGREYYVTVDPGFFRGHRGITSPHTWRFRTADGPPPGSRRLRVDARGGGDFCTVQGAVDSVPEGNRSQVRVDVAPGTYRELVYVGPTRPHLRIRGAGAGRTVIGYPNNNVLNGDSAMADVPPEQSYCPRRVLPEPDRFNCWRAAFGVDADDFRLSDVTVHNLTPEGGSQAEAFRGNGDRIVLERVRVVSFQDSLRLQGRAYVTDSYVEGDVDFVWGTGGVFVRDSELKALDAGYISQVRNGPDGPGVVFAGTRLTRAASVPDGSVLLSRIDSRFPASQAVFVDTVMDSHVAPVGWGLTGFDCTAGQALRFWEYGSTDPSGTPVDTGERLSCSRQLTADEASDWRDPARLLDGWDPSA